VSIVLLSQTMRHKQAAAYLWSRPEEEAKVVVSRDTSRLDVSAFPPATEFFAWGPQGGGSASPRTAASHFGERAKSYMRSGSPLAAALNRWLRSAQWRLRYVDRIQTIVKSIRASHEMDSDGLIELLQQLGAGDDANEIVIFDLFDLPAVRRLGSDTHIEVRIL